VTTRELDRAAAGATRSVLTEEMLERFHQRAPVYDRENRFFTEDFAELQQAGYLRMPVPEEFGGLGLSLSEVCREQRRLAYHAPATALAVNMHLYWVAMAAIVHAMGDSSVDWMLEEAARGEVFAAGHSEAGNDLPALYSTTRAERVDGGYRFYGHKNFGTLTPVWTRFGLHAQDNADPQNPTVVHAFMPRDTPGYRIKETWDTLGMRATASQDTILDGAFVPDRYIGRVVPTDFAGADAFILAIFVAAEPLISNVYIGSAQRLFDLTVASVTTRTSIALGGRTLAHNPMNQWMIAEMAIGLDAIIAHADRIVADWEGGVDHGGLWPAKLVGMKYAVSEGVRRIAKGVLDVCGGASIFKGNEIERLLRDTTLATIHPANAALAHEIVGKTHTGLLGQPPRWG
jgi:alkylation response protein AidB-like acyl-CoA dehydrogenase